MAEKDKETLPLDFIAAFVSKGWEEVGNLKAQIEGIKQTFSGTQKVSKILQDLIDAYLIAIGQMELYIDKKDYLDLPDTEELKEQLIEDLAVEIKPEEDNLVVEIKQPSEEKPCEIENKEETTDDNIAIPEPPKAAKDTEPFEFFTTFEDPVIETDSESPFQAWMSTRN